MNIIYKMIWIDDSDEFIDSTKELVEEIVMRKNMVPKLQIYNQFEEFQRCELGKFDIDIFNLYDLILIDYALSGTTGDVIIRDLRKRNVYTDIVFYSSNFEEMQSELKKSNEQLDGIFFSDRNNLTSVISKVVNKNLKREYNIANIRGLIMDSTSEFDYICRTTTLSLFDILSEGKQQTIIEKAKEYVDNAENISKNNFIKLAKKNGSNFLKNAMDSVEYVMNNKDKYSLMSLVVREFENNPTLGEGFSEHYQAELITPRNDLAHNRLFYGNCQKKLHIAKRKEELSCDDNCDSCKTKYSIDECEHLRETIFKYYLLLSRLTETADELIR